MNVFERELIKCIFNNLDKSYLDNHDFYRWGPRRNRLRSYLKHIATRFFRLRVSRNEIAQYLARLNQFNTTIEKIDCLYEMLIDEKSKSLLVLIFAFRILGDKKIKLPYQKIRKANWNVVKSKRMKNISPLQISFGAKKLYCHDLSSFGCNLKAFLSVNAIINAFYYQQYFMKEIGFIVDPGDVVIDCGACYGDTSLLFSSLAGENGKVYSFEFIQENLNVLEKNIAVNDIKNVQVIKKALWDKSFDRIRFSILGPGSSACWLPEGSDSIEVETITIDDLVLNEKLQKVDFIKMDIEGAELKALYGAEQTIRQFKPRLAISIYHTMDDYTEIANFIKQLNLGYSFRIKHGSMHAEETVLLCS